MEWLKISIDDLVCKKLGRIPKKKKPSESRQFIRSLRSNPIIPYTQQMHVISKTSLSVHITLFYMACSADYIERRSKREFLGDRLTRP